MNPNVENEMEKVRSSLASEQGGTQPEGTSMSPQKVDGCQGDTDGHGSAKSAGVSGKLYPGGSKSSGGY